MPITRQLCLCGTTVDPTKRHLQIRFLKPFYADLRAICLRKLKQFCTEHQPNSDTIFIFFKQQGRAIFVPNFHGYYRPILSPITAITEVNCAPITKPVGTSFATILNVKIVLFVNLFPDADPFQTFRPIAGTT